MLNNIENCLVVTIVDHRWIMCGSLGNKVLVETAISDYKQTWVFFYTSILGQKKNEGNHCLYLIQLLSFGRGMWPFSTVEQI